MYLKTALTTLYCSHKELSMKNNSITSIISSDFYPSPVGILEIQVKNHQLYSISKADRLLDSSKPSGKGQSTAFEVLPTSTVHKKQSASNQPSMDPKLFQQIKLFLNKYFSDKSIPPYPSLPLFVRGSLFQQKVWRYLQKIPYSQTKSYSEVAKGVGAHKAVRAVGSACAKNPFLILVPCHRVVAKNGLGGFALGLSAKKFLLQHEQNALSYSLPS